MTELTEREARELAGAMRPQRRPLLIALTANLLLSGLLLGLPYVRGRLLARHERAHFVGFVRCMIGGRAAPKPGLSLPRGEREHYASKVLFANSDWPLSCRPALERLRPPDAFFLWPSLKTAGADLRVAIDLVDRELVALAKRRTQAPGRIPQRPLEAIKRLQAASALFARAGDTAADIDNDSVVLSESVTGLAAPARLPLMIGENQGLLGWSESGILQVLAFDVQSLAYLRVDGGKVQRERVRRNSFLRGLARAGDTPYLVWAMPETRCAERDDHCAGRPTGLARYERDSSELEEPRWKLPGHPAGRLDRTLSISQTGQVDFLRRSSAHGGIDWVHTRLPDALAAAGAEQKPQWLEAEQVRSIVEAPNAADSGSEAGAAPPPQTANGAGSELASSATLVAGQPAAVLSATQRGAEVIGSIELATAPQTNFALEAVSGEAPWAVACTAGEERFLAYGSSSELRVVRLADGRIHALGAARAELGVPLDPDNRAADRLRLLCEPGHAQLLYIGKDLTLRQLQCDASSCTGPQELTNHVAEFDAVLRRGLGLIAYHQGPLAPTVKLLRLDQQLRPVGPPAIVASCWEPLGGMCGRPTLIADAQRVVLLTRDGPDLLALETLNDGRSFSTLSGIAVGRTLDSSSTSPMQQHRVRKGID